MDYPDTPDMTAETLEFFEPGKILLPGYSSLPGSCRNLDGFAGIGQEPEGLKASLQVGTLEAFGSKLPPWRYPPGTDPVLVKPEIGPVAML